MQQPNIELVVGKGRKVDNEFGLSIVEPVTIGGFQGNVITRPGVLFLDFSEFSPYAVYHWPLGEGDAERIVEQLTKVTSTSSETGLELSPVLDFNIGGNMDQDEKLRMVSAMRTYGGGFVSALAEAFIKADKTNLDKLCVAFPEIVAQYREIGSRKFGKEE